MIYLGSNDFPLWFTLEVMIYRGSKKTNQKSTHNPIEEGNQSVVLQPEPPFLLPFYLNIPYKNSVTQNSGLLSLAAVSVMVGAQAGAW